MFFSFADKNPLQDLGKGMMLKVLGAMENLDAIHWNLDDKTVLKRHQHPQEQFGYVISGSFEATVGDDTAILKAGDSYFIPANTWHQFVAIGQTEAIDMFAPPRDVNEIIRLAEGGDPEPVH
jgi:unsaturated pyranuronate lyase